MLHQLPKRKTVRLENYDYSTAGAYFLTICARERKSIFWNTDIDIRKFHWHPVGANCVRPAGLPLSDTGLIVAEELEAWSKQYDCVYLHSYVIMPDHIHIMVIITSGGSGRTQFAPTDRVGEVSIPTVSRMVKQFKGAVTKRLGQSVWQKSFIDHIIRDRADFDARAQYIFENPVQWYYADR